MPKSEIATYDMADIAARLTSALHLATAPISIAFSDSASVGVHPFEKPMASPADDGRTGRVSAGCVFWMEASGKSFTTEAADHGNCSVGSLTHGLVSMGEVASNSDVAELLGSGWVDEMAVSKIPYISRRYKYVSYGPLADGAFSPDVVLLRLNGRQMMVVSDALGMAIEGKPQCHIIAIAKEHGRVAASVGCALSRARTGMQPSEMTCAIPASLLEEVVEAVEHAADVDTEVAKYAASDARRFAS